LHRRRRPERTPRCRVRRQRAGRAIGPGGVPLPRGARRQLQLRRRDRRLRALEQPLRDRHRARHRAMFVRSLTVMLVQKGTLTEYRYLEHGAFWAIIALAAIMFLQTVTPIPELVTGLIGAGFIGLSFMSSLRHNRRVATAADPRPAR